MSQTLEFSAGQGEGELPKIGMAPLVDIVLLLICFYLLVMRSIQSHTDEFVELPHVQGAYLAELLPAELTINVPRDAPMTLNGTAVDLDALRVAVGEQYARSIEARTSLRVVVRADGRERYGTLDEVLSVCRDVGVETVTLRARGKRPVNFDMNHHEDDGELFQVTAMVDVVFILLAFFVLSVQFQGGERDLLVGQAELGPPTGAAAEDYPAEIVVRLSAGDDGAVRIQVGERFVDSGAFDELTALLTEIDMPSIPVVLVAEASLPIQAVASGLDAVLMSPARQVSLARIDSGGAS